MGSLETPMKAMTDSQYLQQLISEGEHSHQDFKFAITDARKIAKSLSAFANTEGGRLLIGVKDNGRIAGVRSEEEIYMIEAAATMYCRPQVQTASRIYRIEGKNVLEVSIPESQHKPVCALSDDGKPRAYVRINDENIMANAIHLAIWKHNRKDMEVVMAYTERERSVLSLLAQYHKLTLNQCVKLSKMNRRELCTLLADFVRFDLAEQVFIDHRFYFQLKTAQQNEDGSNK